MIPMYEYECVKCPSCRTPYEYWKPILEKVNPSCRHCGRPYKGYGTMSDTSISAMLSHKGYPNPHALGAASMKGVSARCGCGQHMINLTNDKVVRYQDQWWLLRCLFYKVDQRMPRI